MSLTSSRDRRVGRQARCERGAMRGWLRPDLRRRRRSTSTMPTLIQQAGTELRLARGEVVVGWKLGYTSLAMRAQMGIEHPNFGPLTDAMLLGHDEAVSTSLLQPRVEPEIGLRFARSLSGTVSLDDVLSAVDKAFACLEVVDSVYPDYRFRLEDNTADGSSAAQVAVGPALRRRRRLGGGRGGASTQRQGSRSSSGFSRVRSSCCRNRLAG